MTLTVHTARVSYGGPDRLDVTRKSAGPDGIAFAPSWAILRPALESLTFAALLRRASTIQPRPEADSVYYAKVADEIVRTTWALYSEAYTLEMRESYRTQRTSWDALLAREVVTLCCYCVNPVRCHRTLLAGMFEKLGATIGGER